MSALRDHMREWHPKMKLPRAEAALIRAHMEQHHRYTPRSHRHDGPNRGPSERPEGWRTGGGVIVQ